MPAKKKAKIAKGKTFKREGWNAAGTKLWRSTYTVLEVQPSWRQGLKKEPAKTTTKSKAPKKRKPATKAKPATKTTTKAKASTKRTTAKKTPRKKK